MCLRAHSHGVQTAENLDRAFGAGPIRRRDHPDRVGTIDRAVRDGALVPVLPGTHLLTVRAGEPDQLVRAAMAWEPGAVVIGRYAAARQFWPELAHDVIDLAIPRQRSVRSARFRMTRRHVPAELVGRHRGASFSRPALTAIDLCPELGAEVIDRALRSRKVAPEHLRRALALTPQRTGNRLRRAEVLDSVGNPGPGSSASRIGCCARRGSPGASAIRS